jgi:signal transduction histidine kinase
MTVRPRTLCGVVALVAALVTLAVVLIPDLRFAYRDASLRVSIETAAALIALVVAYIFIGRYLRSHRLDHLGVAVGLVTLAASNAFTTANVALGPWTSIGYLGAGTSLAGVIVLAVAAFLPDTRMVRSRREIVAAAAGALGISVLFAFSLKLLFETFPIRENLLDLDPATPHVPTDVALLVVSLLSTLAMAAAAVGFARDAERRPDALLTWLAVGVTIGAFGRFHALLFPPIQSEWVYTGTLFRLAFYLVLLVGAAIEIERYWRGLANEAVLEERRRIARDLHDGVAQELAYIDRASRRLADTAGDEAARQITAAAVRGLADSRRAIAALTRPLDEPLELVLAQATEDVAARTGLDVSFDLAEGVQLDVERREALIRIACEAVANAAVHGRARGVRIELENGRGVRMRVVDDGVGFDPAEAAGRRGFGLVSMRERAEAIGGSFRLRASPGSGTAVEVELP